jgi:hypothetical protein
MWSPGATKNLNLENIKTYPVSNEVCKGNRAQVLDEKGHPYPIIFIAPINLETGDRCTVDISDGYLFEIKREGVSIWRDMVDGP